MDQRRGCRTLGAVHYFTTPGDGRGSGGGDGFTGGVSVYASPQGGLTFVGLRMERMAKKNDDFSNGSCVIGG